ncbi:hypothetical protein [Clostridium sp. JNZ J1-5]
MLGKILEMNKIEALVAFKGGSITNVNLSQIPPYANIGDTVDINLNSPTGSMTNNRMNDFFI